MLSAMVPPKQHDVLRHDRHLLRNWCKSYSRASPAIDQQVPAGRVVEAQEQADEG